MGKTTVAADADAAAAAAADTAQPDIASMA
jgi:hypothetical protein